MNATNVGWGGKVSDGNARGRGVGDGLNAVAGDEDVGVRTNGAGADVDEFAGEHRLRNGRRGGLLRMSCEVGEEEGGNEAAT